MGTQNVANMNHQVAPYPDELAELVEKLTYRPGWFFRLEHTDRGQGSQGLTLCIIAGTINSYDFDEPKQIMHYMPVPPAAYQYGSWRRWLFEQIHQVELHECMEFFTIDGEKPYAPNHGPGEDPYTVKEIGTELGQRTSFRGDLNV